MRNKLQNNMNDKNIDIRTRYIKIKKEKLQEALISYVQTNDSINLTTHIVELITSTLMKNNFRNTFVYKKDKKTKQLKNIYKKLSVNHNDYEKYGNAISGLNDELNILEDKITLTKHYLTLQLRNLKSGNKVIKMEIIKMLINNIDDFDYFGDLKEDNPQQIIDREYLVLHHENPLILSILQNNFEIFKMLVDRGAIANVYSVGGKNMIMMGILYSSFDIIKYLVEESDVDISESDDYGTTIYDLAVLVESEEIKHYIYSTKILKKLNLLK